MQCSSVGPFTFSHTHKHKVLWSATGYVLSDDCLNKLHLNACMSACVFVCVCEYAKLGIKGGQTCVRILGMLTGTGAQG